MASETIFNNAVIRGCNQTRDMIVAMQNLVKEQNQETIQASIRALYDATAAFRRFRVFETRFENDGSVWIPLRHISDNFIFLEGRGPIMKPERMQSLIDDLEKVTEQLTDANDLFLHATVNKKFIVYMTLAQRAIRHTVYNLIPIYQKVLETAQMREKDYLSGASLVYLDGILSLTYHSGGHTQIIRLELLERTGDSNMDKVDLRMSERDPRITFAVCVGHACEEAMEALQAFDNLDSKIYTIFDGKGMPTEEMCKEFEEALNGFMEETADVISAVRRLAFYAKAEDKLLTPEITELIESISGEYVGFDKLPALDPFQIAVGTSMYAYRTLRTLGQGYPSRHPFEEEFPRYLDHLRELLRLLIVKEIKYKLVEGDYFDDDKEWRHILKYWVELKAKRKRDADLAEGNDYYAGGY